ncbi:alpha-2-macroglobulin family protein [Robbsia andropogonis]|uniref:alpha-2-macroglobulin family protein n=1 Tax=Robbsia andropogonis TaxID=28092 RepID=UPI001589E7A2|nr:MG2 domain-containing protein [Robbsia andropogonis]MCP1118138.1 MG2 domain-containing protein [Robbsia andropogonis]MCP1127581.1 MG2 domain-containing protein [Robbsia andropogonis]
MTSGNNRQFDDAKTWRLESAGLFVLQRAVKEELAAPFCRRRTIIPRRTAVALRTILGVTLAAAMSMPGAYAARIVSMSPQGTASEARQVVATFDEAMVRFGDAAAPAPATVECDATQGSIRGQGHWRDARTWLYDFEQDLPAGSRCRIGLNQGIRAISGTAFSGPPLYRFNTGGPYPLSVQPSQYTEIEEHQVFVLRLTSPVETRSALENIWCEVSGIGNRIPVQSADDATRKAVLAHFKLGKDAARVLTLSCAQALPAAAKMQLVFGAGVAAPNGVRNESEKRFDFTVHDPFTATFSCERENASAPCTPLSPLRIAFNAPIPRAQAEAIRVQTPKGTLSPVFKADDHATEVVSVEFAAPLPIDAALTVTLPPNLRDVAGRSLSNADGFPLSMRTAALPPLAKFASGTFGIIERFAEPNMPAIVPVTLRRIEPSISVTGNGHAGAQTMSPLAQGARLNTLRIDDDYAIRKWMRLVERFDNGAMTVKSIEDARPGLLAKGQDPVYPPPAPDQPAPKPQDREIDIRSLSLLAGQSGVQAMTIPGTGEDQANSPRPFEVIGIPLQKPGFYVLELASGALGRSLLAAPKDMYVRTAVLVTNLSVHFKRGRDNSLVWVTSLDKGLPVPNATVRVSDCNGDELALGVTDAQGLYRIDASLANKRTCAYRNGVDGLFVSARIDDPKTGPDMAFVRADWNRGIESWRFDVPTDTDSTPTVRAHAVFDRTLLRLGETVSMKFFLRTETLTGLAFPADYPSRAIITHLGSGDTYRVPLTWNDDHASDIHFEIPHAAKLGAYSVSLESGDENAPTQHYDAGSFRVEAFRLPILKGAIAVRDDKADALIGVKEVPLALQIAYTSGGGAAKLPVQVSAMTRSASVPFSDRYPGFSFTPYRVGRDNGATDNGGDDGDGNDGSATPTIADPDAPRLVADKLPITLDRNGEGTITVKNVPVADAPRELSLEARFADPNGEVQTLRGGTMIWPAAVAVGIRTTAWIAVGQKVAVDVVAVDLQGKPSASVPIEVKGISRTTTSNRKRMVGGFYAYDNHDETHDLGVLCKGTSDAQGRLHCDAALSRAGNIQIVAVAKDGDGKAANASSSVWVAHEEDLWFGGDNTDRIDIIPEQRDYEPGDTARFQVRMPFREARALVAVERAGVMETHVVTLNGKQPNIALKVGEDWGPNVYVSVLAIRGRLHVVPWYSFFTWGWKSPMRWTKAFLGEGREYRPPSMLVDLSKPTFRYGLAEIRVGTRAHRLDVAVSSDASRYPVRGKAQVTVRVTQLDGKPAPAGTRIALAAVDEALLELMPNRSWNLLDAMLQRRGYGVETATAQMEVVGRRHFGRKAVPAGGGGGTAPTRELFDTLLLWSPNVVLDANGSAKVTVPLNDSLTRFRVVAIASVGAERFGNGSTSFVATQDLQLISGLPPVVRVGDTFRAQFTVRNTTERPMSVLVTPRIEGASGAMPKAADVAPSSDASGMAATGMPPRTVKLAPGTAQEVAWMITVPPPAETLPDAASAVADPASGAAGSAMAAKANGGSVLRWRVEASEQRKDTRPGPAAEPAAIILATDALSISETVMPAVPVTVQQATLEQIDGLMTMPVSAPAAAITDGAPSGMPVVRGGIAVSLAATLADGLPGVTRWLHHYPYDCLEQQASRAIGLRDLAQWQAVQARMPAYLDADGLPTYFPPSDDTAAHGSPTLAAYLLVLADEAQHLDPRFALPNTLRDSMVGGLVGYVAGRVTREGWAPQEDRDLRKLAAIEALSRYGAARASMLDSVALKPDRWPTSAVLDYAAILSRLQDIPQRDKKRAALDQILRARLTWQGTQLVFSTAASDDLWWLMTGSQTNAARMLLDFLNDPGWQDALPRMATGLLAMQRNGAWSTTTANALGTLAITRFSRKFERAPVNGTTRISVGSDDRALRWPSGNDKASLATLLPWASAPSAPRAVATGSDKTRTTDVGVSSLRIVHQGSGKPWATIESLAAVPVSAPFAAGYRIKKTITPLSPAEKGRYTRGDVLRVRIEVDAQSPMTWVVVNDPVPSGATILGSGLGRDADMTAQVDGQRPGADDNAWPEFIERSFDGYRAYFSYLPKGHFSIEYTVRLNNVGTFGMPPTRVEALYAPSVYGVAPNAPVTVAPQSEATSS